VSAGFFEATIQLRLPESYSLAQKENLLEDLEGRLKKTRILKITREKSGYNIFTQNFKSTEKAAKSFANQYKIPLKVSATLVGLYKGTNRRRYKYTYLLRFT
jgi:NMD protein affecting ribosome stability and mRNA decay